MHSYCRRHERNLCCMCVSVIGNTGSNGYIFPLLCCLYGLDKSILACLWEAEKGKTMVQKYVDLSFLAEREGFISVEDTPWAHLFRTGFLCECACVRISSVSRHFIDRYFFKRGYIYRVNFSLTVSEASVNVLEAVILRKCNTNCATGWNWKHEGSYISNNSNV